MKVFLDTEFIETEDVLELVSLGMATEDGREYYGITKNYEYAFDDDWVRQNVLAPINAEFSSEPFNYKSVSKVFDKFGKTRTEMRDEIKAFLGTVSIEFWSYFSAYDWVLFCRLFGSMNAMPKNYPYLCNDIKQLANSKDLSAKWIRDNYPKSKKAHNALADAKWHKEMYERVISVS